MRQGLTEAEFTRAAERALATSQDRLPEVEYERFAKALGSARTDADLTPDMFIQFWATAADTKRRTWIKPHERDGVVVAGYWRELGPSRDRGGTRQKLRRVNRRWAQVAHDSRRFIDQAPLTPAEVNNLEKQRRLMKIMHHLNADQGDAAGIGKPGGPRDVVIVGAGPAGLAAAITGSSESLDILLVDANEAPGGQAALSTRIENFPGFTFGVAGDVLTKTSFDQAVRMGTDTQLGTKVTGMTYDPETGFKHLRLSNGTTVETRAVIVAGGVQFHPMHFPGSDSRHVFYGDARSLAAVCEEEDAIIVGGGNSAGQGALHVAETAKSVTVLIRGKIKTKMSGYLIAQLRATPNIKIMEGAEIATAEKGPDDGIESVTLKDGKRLPAKGIALFIGQVPKADWATELERDEKGYILGGRGDTSLETRIPGVMVAGDVRSGSTKRVGFATGEGIGAISEIHTYLDELREAAGILEKAAKDEEKVDLDEADAWEDDEVDLWFQEVLAYDREYPYTGADEDGPWEASTRIYVPSHIQGGFRVQAHWADNPNVAQVVPVPDAPGSTPIPETHIRLFHYTAGPSATTGGVDLARARSGRLPGVIWAVTTVPHEKDRVYVEFSVPLTDPSIVIGTPSLGEAPDDYMAKQQPVGFDRSIRSSEVIAVHQPWHHHYRYVAGSAPLQSQIAADPATFLEWVAGDAPLLRAVQAWLANNPVPAGP